MLSVTFLFTQQDHAKKSPEISKRHQRIHIQLIINWLHYFTPPDKAPEDALGYSDVFQPHQAVPVLSPTKRKTLGDPDSPISIPPNVVPGAELRRGPGSQEPNCLPNCVSETLEHRRPTAVGGDGDFGKPVELDFHHPTSAHEPHQQDQKLPELISTPLLSSLGKHGRPQVCPSTHSNVFTTVTTSTPTAIAGTPATVTWRGRNPLQGTATDAPGFGSTLVRFAHPPLHLKKAEPVHPFSPIFPGR